MDAELKTRPFCVLLRPAMCARADRRCRAPRMALASERTLSSERQAARRPSCAIRAYIDARKVKSSHLAFAEYAAPCFVWPTDQNRLTFPCARRLSRRAHEHIGGALPPVSERARTTVVTDAS